MICVGVMTGTSLDGIDIAICDIGDNPSLSNDFELLCYETVPFSSELRAVLTELIIEQKISLKELSQLNAAFTDEIAEAIIKVLRKNDIEEIELVGCHGQTLWHNPTKEEFAGRNVSSTFQLFSGERLAARLSTMVVSDFRSADVALGGQGAPLVPIFDYFFLRSDSENVIALNIGGISNISYIPKSSKEDELIAFDVGPGNTLIDLACKFFYGKDYDKDGNYAIDGNIIPELFDKLKSIDFISQKPPKSTGRELFSKNLIDKYFSEEYNANDVLRTLTEFTVYCISENIRHFADESSRIIVSGGGANNRFMMDLLKLNLLKSEIVKSDDIGLPGDAKEAIAFAYLAWRRYMMLFGNLPNVTGATDKTLLGAISEG